MINIIKRLEDTRKHLAYLASSRPAYITHSVKPSPHVDNQEEQPLRDNRRDDSSGKNLDLVV